MGTRGEGAQSRALSWLSGNVATLSALYVATDGAHWHNNSNWRFEPGADPCPGPPAWVITEYGPTAWYTSPWFGVSCVQGNVSALSLSDNNLAGTMPPELGDLDLEYELQLYDNQISGFIPSQVGKLSRMSWDIGFDGNQLSGTMPTEIGMISRLTNRLYMDRNSISGILPTELGRITRLASSLYLSVNAFSGTMPSELGALSKLRFGLGVAGNMISGFLPTELGALSKLALLDVSMNNFTLRRARATLERCNNPTVCLGLPSASCTAYGNYAPIVGGATSCVDCSGSFVWTYVALAGLLAALIGGFFFFGYLIFTSKRGLQRYVSTCMILLSHLQALVIIQTLSKNWPPIAQFIIAIFTLNGPELPRVSCFFRHEHQTIAEEIATSGGEYQLWTVPLVFCAVNIILLVGVSAAVLACRWGAHVLSSTRAVRRLTALGDNLELGLSVLLALPLFQSWHFVSALFRLAAAVPATLSQLTKLQDSGAIDLDLHLEFDEARSTYTRLMQLGYLAGSSLLVVQARQPPMPATRSLLLRPFNPLQPSPTLSNPLQPSPTLSNPLQPSVLRSCSSSSILRSL